jgi:hypothetical protein
MEGILKFDLNDPDDRMSHLRAVKSLDLALFAWDMSNFAKNLEYVLDSYEDDDKEMSAYELLELVRAKITEVFDDHAITITDLII